MSHKTKQDKTPFKKWTDVEKEIDGAGARRKEGAKSRPSTATSGARPVEKGIAGLHASPDAGARSVGKPIAPREGNGYHSGRKLPKATKL